MVAPYFAVWLNSFVDKLSRAILPRIGREFRFDNKRVSYFPHVHIFFTHFFFTLKILLHVHIQLVDNFFKN